jgi:hypothetical protein
MRPYLVKRRSHLAGSGWKGGAYDLGASSSRRMSEETLLRHFERGDRGSTGDRGEILQNILH